MTKTQSSHESKARSKVLSTITENDVVVTADFKMKFESTQFMEAQSEYFGKAGMTWHGTWVVVKQDNKFHSTFFHNVSDVKKEDSFVVLSYIAEAMRRQSCLSKL